MAYYDEDGNVVEGLATKEEVEKQIAEVNTKFSEQITAEKTAAEARTKELEAQVEAAKDAVDKAGDDGDKSENLAKMRAKLKETTDALESEKKGNAERWSVLEGDRVANSIAAAVGDNKDLADKVKFHFEKTLAAVSAKSATEIQEKVNSAMKLAGGNVGGPSALDSARSGFGGPGAGVTRPGGAQVYSDKDKAIGKAFGVSDADYKKYANDPRLG